MSNILKYSFVSVFMFAVLMSTFFVDKVTKVVSAAINTPTITEIDPISGNTNSPVIITGTNFTGISGVSFGSIDIGTNFKVNSINQITANVPSGFTSGKITVKSTNGNAISSQTFTLDNTVKYNLGKITATKITASSVAIFFSAEGKTPNNTYLIDIAKKNNPTSDTTKFETFRKSDVSASGFATINFTGLISNTDYIATITSQAATSAISFKTLPKSGDAIAPTIYTTNVTPNSASVNFSIANKSEATPPYTVYVDDKLNGYTDPTGNQYKTIDGNQINNLGLAVLNFTGLKSNTEYIAKLEHNNIVLSEINFKTNPAYTIGKITSISPVEGKVGDTITISGENLTGAAEVYFNGVLAVTSTNNQTEIVVKVPASAVSGNITVNFVDGGSVSSTMSFKVIGTTGAYTTTGTTGAYTTTGTSNVPRKYEFKGLVPICNTKIDTASGGFSDPCDFDVVMALINKLISYVLVVLATPLFALIIIYVGWLYLSDMGSSTNITKAKTILKNAVIGYVIALAAWLIVKTILLSVGFNGPMFLS